MNPPSPSGSHPKLLPWKRKSAKEGKAESGGASLEAVLLVAVLVVGILVVVGWLKRRSASGGTDRAVQVSKTPAKEPGSKSALTPAVRFTDITAAAGIHFTHFNGAEGERLLPETMGGGAAFLDFDADGDPDILFVNGSPWPWARERRDPPPTHALYRNDGTGRFTDITAGSGLDVSFYGMGIACGDIDNDGLTDVFLTAVGPNRLFRNLGAGKFTEITETAGVAGNPGEWSSSAAFMDIDRDGDLDLFVANYVRWTRELDHEVGFSLDGKTRAYGPPMSFQGTFPALYRNDGQGRFTNISEAAGIQVRNPSTGAPAAKALGIAPVDLNEDGWMDVVVANDTVPNLVFTNRHDGTFAETGAALGIAFDALGNARGAMGIDTARHRNDASLTIGIGNFANEMTALYVAQAGSGVFTDEALMEGVGAPSRVWLKFGLLFLDYDLDGWSDLLTVNGHLDEQIARLPQSQPFQQPAQLFWNAGATRRGFIETKPDRTGDDLFRPIIGRGSAVADLEGDGDPDVLFLQAGAPPLLLRNDQDLGHSWVRFQLAGTRSNRDAIGAWIHLTSNGTTQSRQVMPARSYLSHSELPVTFGLGRGGRIDTVEIQWPSGVIQKLTNLQTNTLHRIEEPAESTEPATSTAATSRSSPGP